MLDTSMMDLLSGLKAKKIQIELPSHLWHSIDETVLDIIKNKGKNKRRNNENRKF